MRTKYLAILPTLITSACMEQTFSTLDKLPPGEDTAYLDDAESTGDNEYNDENEDSDVPEEAETEEEPEELEVEPPPEDDCTDSSDLIYTVDKNTQKMYILKMVRMEL